MMARKKLDRVELPEKGKIRTQEFKDFEIRFSDALKKYSRRGSRRGTQNFALQDARLDAGLDPRRGGKT